MKSKIVPGQRPRLDRESIIDAAILRIERDGLEELSARKLAQDLGCEAMSLYHHVANMEALKDAVVDKLLGSIAPASASEPGEALRQEAQAYLRLASTHPRTFQLVVTRRWKGERAAATAARAISHFCALGLSQDDALARARTLGAYLNGAGLALAAWAADPEALPADAKRVTSDLKGGLALILQSLVHSS